MKAILRTNEFSEDYCIVDIIKNPASNNNSLAYILKDGELFYTGGILCEVNNITLSILDKLTNKEQWLWLLSIKCPNLYV